MPKIAQRYWWKRKKKLTNKLIKDYYGLAIRRIAYCGG